MKFALIAIQCAVFFLLPLSAQQPFEGSQTQKLLDQYENIMQKAVNGTLAQKECDEFMLEIVRTHDDELLGFMLISGVENFRKGALHGVEAAKKHAAQGGSEQKLTENINKALDETASRITASIVKIVQQRQAAKRK